ncbi:hypothetical protein OOJ91_33615 [Micromonospora lupini]|uniref:hypothetical protein n=1 Tax=Micromonospora lupini TaxID=285679 RepID=UPI00224F5905|nr:hypothetical protein [Micromonospora lupini]MCX5070785.1 hypothetical protein [Micromonospora lupini]
MESARRSSATPTARRPDDAAGEALSRLTARFRDSDSAPRLLERDAAAEVLRAFERGEQLRRALGTPEPNAQDCLDALSQGAAVRRAVDYQELQLVARARQLGEGWHRIGVALGYAEGSAAKLAKARYDRLREQFPGSGEPTVD